MCRLQGVAMHCFALLKKGSLALLGAGAGHLAHIAAEILRFAQNGARPCCLP